MERVVAMGVWPPVNTPNKINWSSRAVLSPKNYGTVHIYGNYKMTINPVLKPVATLRIDVNNILANQANDITFPKVNLEEEAIFLLHLLLLSGKKRWRTS